jgi:hypothetical protein
MTRYAGTIRPSLNYACPEEGFGCRQTWNAFGFVATPPLDYGIDIIHLCEFFDEVGRNL